ncbi:MAG TPA: galactose-1-epimerase, partial [Allosphingosinicella sp.]
MADAAGGASRSEFGRLPDGRTVDAATLTNSVGMSVTILAWGAGIQSVLVPGRDGTFADVALGHRSVEPYVRQPQYIGST